MQKDPEMLEEYDFSTGIQGKYAKRYTEGTNIVVIDPDVAKVFPDHDSVNRNKIARRARVKYSSDQR
jgi:hypothetical protein